jgi:Carboxypeptidase regulatory-like domain
MRTRLPCFSTLAIVIFFFVCAPITAQETGSIRGIVVDQDGVPVADAEVNASPVGGWRTVRALQYVETDSSGHFSIGELALGKWAVFVKKEQAKYADTSASFYSDNVFPIAALTPAAPVAEVRVQLGPRAGLLTGSVTNAANGAPVSAGFTLTRAAAPDEWLGTSAPAEYRILLPSSTDVLVEVSEPGFTTWSPGHPLRLQPGAEVRMDIQLEPSHDPNLHKSRFLVPDGYAGWLLLEYGVKDTEPVPVQDDVKVFRFPSNGALSTSSGGPERGAEDEYLYYSANGSLRPIPSDYRSGGGMIWGQHEGTRNGQVSQFGFFVGTEEQYEKFKTRMTHPGPIPTP